MFRSRSSRSSRSYVERSCANAGGIHAAAENSVKPNTSVGQARGRGDCRNILQSLAKGALGSPTLGARAIVMARTGLGQKRGANSACAQRQPTERQSALNCA